MPVTYEVTTDKGTYEVTTDGGESATSQQTPSIASQGLGYLQQHPVLSAIQPVLKTLTGQSAQDMAQQASQIPIPQATQRPFDSNVQMAGSPMGNAIRTAIPAIDGTLGGITDAMTTPSNIALGAGLGLVGKGIIKAIPFAKGLINGPEQAQLAASQAKLGVAQKATDAIAQAQKTGGIKIDIANRNADAVKQGYQNLTANLQKQVGKYSDKEAQQLQQDLPKLFAQKSQEYGTKLQNIIESLPESRSSVPASNIVQGMEDSLVDHGVLRYDPTGQLIQARTTLTPTESGILDLYKSTKGQLADNPGSKIDIQDLMKNQSYLKPKFGKAWTPDDRLGASVSENISKNIEDVVPEIKDLRTEYKPFLQWKSQVIKDTQPFNNQFDTTRSASLLSKVGSPNIKPDEQRLVSQLEQNIGRQVGGGRINALNKGIQQVSQNQSNASDLAQQTVQKLKDNIARDVENIKQNKNLSMQQIDDATNKLVQKYKNQRILTGAALGGLTLASGGKLLEYFIRREAYSGLHGRY